MPSIIVGEVITNPVCSATSSQKSNSNHVCHSHVIPGLDPGSPVRKGKYTCRQAGCVSIRYKKQPHPYQF
jgi:hypothetical protein